MQHTRIKIVLIAMTLQLTGHAQQKEYVQYDSLTYQLYLNKENKTLLKVGKEAIRDGIDYYYLRIRMGIAAYNQHRYRLAAKHFDKARLFSDNEVLSEYIYYSNLWGGHTMNAQVCANQMSTDLQTRLNIRPKTLISTHVDLAYLTLNGSTTDASFPEQDDGFQLIPRQFYNATIGMSHKLGTKTKLTHALTYLSKTSDQYTYYEGLPNWTYNVPVNQYQYYLTAQHMFTKNWELKFAGHLAHMTYPGYVLSNDGINYTQITKDNQDYLFSASLQKAFPYFSFEGDVSYMAIQSNPILQPSAILSFFPLANLNLYFVFQPSIKFSDSKQYFLHQELLGFRLSKKIWMEFSYLSANTSGFAMSNGYLMFNGLEEVNNILSASTIFPLNKHLKINLAYQSREQSNYFITSTDVNAQSNKLSYHYSLYSFLLSWTL